MSPLGSYSLRRLVPTLAMTTLLAVASAKDTPAPAMAQVENWRASVRQFAQQHLRHPAWGYSHSVRDYELAKALATEDHVTVDDDVLFAAAYLHDVAAFAPYERPGVDHAAEAAGIVAGLVSGTGFPMAKIEAVRAAIRTHMFDRKPIGPEAIYLHDADALDWLGAVGVARIFALVDPNGAQPDGPAALKMLRDNLASVPPGIVSRAGRARSVPRIHELEQYLQNLSDETHAFQAL